jgi:hypothetical protein
MKDKHIISDLQNATAIYYQSIKPTVLKEAEARQKRILDADYRAFDLDDYAHKNASTKRTTRQTYLFYMKIS